MEFVPRLSYSMRTDSTTFRMVGNALETVAWIRLLPSAASFHAEEVPKIEIRLFPTSPWKWSTVPYFFSHPIWQLTLYQINKGHEKWYVRLGSSWMSSWCVAFPVTAPCSLERGYRTFGGTQCLYVQGSRGGVWPYLHVYAELTKVKLDYCYACVFLKGLPS